MKMTDEIDLSRMFWISSQGETTGPFTLEQISEMWRCGRIYATAQACEVDTVIWFPITNLKRDFSELMSTGRTVVLSTSAPQKSDLESVHVGIYRVLAVLLGHIGVHNFYSGDVTAGIWKIGLMALGMLLVFSGSSVFVLFGAIFLLILVVWIVVEVVNGPTRPDDKVDRAARWVKTEAEKREARQPLMYLAFFALLIIAFFLLVL